MTIEDEGETFSSVARVARSPYSAPAAVPIVAVSYGSGDPNELPKSVLDYYTSIEKVGLEIRPQRLLYLLDTSSPC